MLFDAPANAFLHAQLVFSRRILLLIILLNDTPNEVPSMSLLTTESKEERGTYIMVTDKSTQQKSFLYIPKEVTRVLL